MNFLIKHDRPNCIGCTLCANICPGFWMMNNMDGRADIVGAKKRDDGWQELEISEEDYEVNKQAAESCPVNVIHIININSGEQII